MKVEPAHYTLNSATVRHHDFAKPRTMKIYTKTGDNGQTGLFGGPRVAKDDRRIDAYGGVDELNSWIGMCRVELPPAEIDALLERIQNELFDLGAELATPEPKEWGVSCVSDVEIERLEQAIDRWEDELPPLKQFILPHGSRAAAALHVARTICRRVERSVVTLARESSPPISPLVVCYLNRLSDLLFVLARAANTKVGLGEVTWKPRAER